MGIIQYLKDYYYQLPLLVQVVWLLIFFFILYILILISYIGFIRGALRSKNKERIVYKRFFEDLLFKYIVASSAEERDIILVKFNRQISKKFRRKVLVSSLFGVMMQVSGEKEESVKKIYSESGLEQLAIKDLKIANKWNVIAGALVELMRFKIDSDEAKNYAKRYINHEREEVRRKAHLYLISLFGFKGLFFLDELTEGLSEWIQIQLLENLRKFDDREMEGLHSWLQSKNDTVVLFALKLARIYKRSEVKDDLFELLSHENVNIRTYTIIVLVSLLGSEAKERIRPKFNALALEEKICFLELLEKEATPEDILLAKENLQNENLELSFLAQKIIAINNSLTMESLNDLQSRQLSSVALKSKK
ncbi:hypothetical protein DI487_09705 [Flavobacterium sediminis]|uniref:HEAT repeat domain-containing protein n=2 Tax=Flavobacterium sediminis TaxID=2201181 RepID=A0A2U8QV72_9FLAO|nr:hypothetical protein DI487_09705 [Flavobacterium sediminis]